MSKIVIDRAVPVLTEPSQTPAARIAAGTVHIAALRNSPEWASAPEVQTATEGWLVENDSLDASVKAIAELESKLSAARSAQVAAMRRWDTRKRAVLSAVEAACDGSKDQVQRFGLAVATRKPLPLAVVPEGLQARRSATAGVASVVWTTRKGNRGYMVQHATNPDDPSTFSAPIISSKGKFQLSGQTPGETLYCRVKAIDPDLPNGQTDYTTWVAMMVSS